MGLKEPSHFVIGAPRCGTTSLHAFLGTHPHIFVSNPKEPDLFSWVMDEVQSQTDRLKAIQDYQALYQGCSAPVSFDCSPNYFPHPEAPSRIRRVRPGAHFILVVRDPVQRAWSNYLWRHHRNAWPNQDRRSFLRAIDDEMNDPASDQPREHAFGYISPGRYGTHLKRWLDHFNRNRFLILESSDVHDRSKMVGRLADYLDVDPSEFGSLSAGHNKYKGPRNQLTERLLFSDSFGRWLSRRKPAFQNRVRESWLLTEQDKLPVPQDARRRLEDIYRPEVQKIRALADQALSSLDARWIKKGDQC